MLIVIQPLLVIRIRYSPLSSKNEICAFSYYTFVNQVVFQNKMATMY